VWLGGGERSKRGDRATTLPEESNLSERVRRKQNTKRIEKDINNCLE